MPVGAVPLYFENDPRNGTRIPLLEVVKIDTGLKKNPVAMEPYLPGRQSPAAFFQIIPAAPDEITQ